MDPDTAPPTPPTPPPPSAPAVPLHQDVSIMRHILDKAEEEAHRVNWLKVLSALSLLGGLPVGVVGSAAIKTGQWAAVFTEILNSPQLTGAVAPAEAHAAAVVDASGVAVVVVPEPAQ